MRAVVVIAFTLAVTPLAIAKENPVSMVATVNATEVRAGDTFQLDVVVTLKKNATLDSLVLPDLSAFTVVRDNESQRSAVQIRGGKRTVTLEQRYTYLLATDRPGRHVVGAGNARLGKDIARSAPITIVVTKSVEDKRPKSKPTNNDPHQLELTFDKEEVFVGEQVTLSARVLATTAVDLRPLNVPKLPQFWVEILDQGGGRPTERSVDGKHFYVYPLHKAALFPLEPGQHAIDTLSVEATVGGGLWSRGKTFTLNSAPLSVVVKPLPKDGRPPDFDAGNVGRFELRTRVEPRRTRVGQPVTVEVLIEGVGNGGQARLPTLPERIDGARVFPPTFDERKAIVDGAVAVSKKATMLVQPTRAGRLTIPGLRLAYFDPATERYEIKEVAPLTIVVDDAVVGEGTAAGGNGRQRILAGARPVRANVDVARVFAPYRSSLFFPSVAFALSLSGAAAFWGRARARRRGSKEELAERARRQRPRTLADAKTARDLHLARGVVDEALSARLDTAVNGLSKEQLEVLLADAGFDDDTRRRIVVFVHDVEAILYAPASGVDRRAMFDEAEHLLQKIDEARPQSVRGAS